MFLTNDCMYRLRKEFQCQKSSYFPRFSPYFQPSYLASHRQLIVRYTTGEPRNNYPLCSWQLQPHSGVLHPGQKNDTEVMWLLWDTADSVEISTHKSSLQWGSHCELSVGSQTVPEATWEDKNIGEEGCTWCRSFQYLYATTASEE